MNKKIILIFRYKTELNVIRMNLKIDDGIVRVDCSCIKILIFLKICFISNGM